MTKTPKEENQAYDDGHLTIARQVLEHEAAAIAGITGLLDEQFSIAISLVNSLVGSHGRLIVLGMGKAGFIAQKVSATFASIGVSSFFLHPAEAIHGDLGRFLKRDIALVFSNSGETPEIVKIMPMIKRFGCSIIAITAQGNSALAQHSDVVLRIGAISEADPLGLAPTASTTAMLALGDALAIASAHARGMSREEFALYHPGGSLGRSLMRVADIMRTGNEHCIVTGDKTTREVIHCIAVTEGRPGAATIIGEEGELVGIFTDGDLRRLLDEQPGEFLHRPIRELMSRNPKTVTPGQLATEALRILAQFHIDQLIVIDEKRKPVGLIDIQDLIDLRDVEAKRTP